MTSDDFRQALLQRPHYEDRFGRDVIEIDEAVEVFAVHAVTSETSLDEAWTAAPDRPRYPRTEAGLRLARQSLSKAVTIDQILDIEDQAVALALAERLRDHAT